jgi:hypothetical protein
MNFCLDIKSLYFSRFASISDLLSLVEKFCTLFQKSRAALPVKTGALLISVAIIICYLVIYCNIWALYDGIARGNAIGSHFAKIIIIFQNVVNFF